jgi:hypothetical protein
MDMNPDALFRWLVKQHKQFFISPGQHMQGVDWYEHMYGDVGVVVSGLESD